MQYCTIDILIAFIFTSKTIKIAALNKRLWTTITLLGKLEYEKSQTPTLKDKNDIPLPPSFVQEDKKSILKILTNLILPYCGSYVKKLSTNSIEGALNDKEFKDILNLIPNLNYLDISFCSKVGEIGFKPFLTNDLYYKNLKTLILSGCLDVSGILI